MDLLVGELLEVGEIEAEILVANERSLLLHMSANDLAQCTVQQVGAGVIVGYALPAGGIHFEGESTFRIGGQTVRDMDGEVVLLDGVENLDFLSVGGDGNAGIADFAAHLSVERSGAEHQLKHLFVLLHHLAALQQQHSGLLHGVVAGELHILAFVVDGPVAKFIGGGVTGALLLFAELHLEAFQIHLVSLLARD